VGACCGSTPDHIAAFKKVMDEYLISRNLQTQRSPA